MSEIKPGDVVKLKSGGKHMAVEAVDGGMCFVVGEKDGELIRWHVAVAALEIIKAAGPTHVTGLR